MPYQDDSLSPICPVCYRPVDLETCNTNEDGEAIHEECYLLKLHQAQARPTLDRTVRHWGSPHK